MEFSVNQLNDRAGKISKILENYYKCLEDAFKPLQASYQKSCTQAVQAAKDMGDEGNTAVIQKYFDDTKATAEAAIASSRNSPYADNYGQLFLPAVRAAKTADQYCTNEIAKYNTWQIELDTRSQRPCKSEPTFTLPADDELYSSALKNTTALGDVLDSLMARLAVVQSKIDKNKITINNVNYSDLVVDITDKQTFDYSLPSSLPIVSVVGASPQKLKFVLPAGADGNPGDPLQSLPGEDFKGAVPSGPRGPPGPQSFYSGLPEQWAQSG
jgi:hypothetical protein